MSKSNREATKPGGGSGAAGGVARRAAAALALGLVALGGAAAAQAASQAQIDLARDKAAAWLILNQRGDGLWSNNGGTDMSVSGQALAALVASRVRGYPVLNGNAWLLNSKAESVDALSRVLMARALPSIDQVAGFEMLLSWKNSDVTALNVRQWGSYPQYATSFPDTALAWRAILTMSYELPSLQTPFLQTLCSTLGLQRPDGGWAINRPVGYLDSTAPVPDVVAAGSVLSTAQMVLMLEMGKTRYPLGSFTCGTNILTQVTTSINNAVTWLTTTVRNGDGGVGENGVSSNIATAQAYLALQTAAPANAATASILDYMILGGRQGADGSWSGDPMVTAVMLEALSKIATPATQDTDGDGIPDSIEVAMGSNPNVPDARSLAGGTTGAGQAGITLPMLIANIPVNVLYSGSVPVIGGTGPYSWSITAGLLPPGLALGPTSAGASTTLTGTPTALGPYVFEYSVQDSTGARARTIGEIDVVRATPGTGDINNDGKVDLADVILARRYALGLATPTAEQKARADVAPAGEPDGVIDASDVLRILRKALGLDNF